MPRPDPRTATYLVATVISLSFSYDLLRMPIQVSDSLVELLAVQKSPSVYATFVENIGAGAYLRPLRLAQVKALFDLADGHYWLAYRGFHAALLAIAVLLFVRVLDVRTWFDFAAGVFALTVLTGHHTFRGTVREAFPINHFLEIVIFCLIALDLARSRGGWVIDAVAAAVFVMASLTLESGLLVWVVVVTAWACGMRGISTRGAVVVTALLIAYMGVRFLYLSQGTPGLEERSAGFLLHTLEPDELQRRFGANPVWFYAYNVAASVMSVLFAEPQSGVFKTVRAWQAGDVPPRLYVATISSAITTMIIFWVAARRLLTGAAKRSLSATRFPGGLRRRFAAILSTNDQLLVVFGSVLAANSILSYAYTKDEIVSVAGAFYAFAAFAAARYSIEYLRQPLPRVRRVAVCLLLFTAAMMWAFRSAGVHHMLRVEAFKHRNNWARPVEARYVAPGSSAEGPDTMLIRQLRYDALEMRVPNPQLLPRWNDRWWGE